MSTPADPFPSLAEVAKLEGAAEREGAAAAAVRALLLDSPDEFTCQRLRADVKRRHLMTVAMFDALAREARELTDPGPPVGAPAAPVLPAGAHKVIGSPGWFYVPADAGLPGEVGELRGSEARRVLPWAPSVPRFLETLSELGGATAYYYDIAAGGRSVIASGDELAAGEPWKLLPVPGTGAKRVREVLANVVLAEAARLEPTAALTRTGWHRDADGARFYVFADGRTSDDGRTVCLVPMRKYAHLALAARPAPPADSGDVAVALIAVAEHGRGPGLAGIGIGVRALAHSLHKVPGGFLVVGKPNAGKTSLAWHARTLVVAREGRADAWPPLPSATFTYTPAYIETALDYEADMPGLVDDGAVHDKSSRAEVADLAVKLERIFRPLANDAPPRGRMDRTMLPQESRHVRSPVIATVQGSVADVPVQNSLLRRLLLLPVIRGDVDIRWYRSKDGNAARLVAPLRTLGEHLVIPWLAVLGDQAPAYVATKDAEALELLAAELGTLASGWEDSAEGLAGVADVAACALAGLLIACEVTNLSPGILAAEAVPYLAAAVAAQGARMSDSAADATPGEALGEVLRAALLDGRAHVRDADDFPTPAIPGLTEQEQGLEQFGAASEYVTRWRGRGVPVYWLPDVPAVGVPGEGLHKLIRSAADGRVPIKTAKSLPGYLVAEGVALPSGQQTSNGTHQKRIGGRKTRLVYVRPEIFSEDITTDADVTIGTIGTTGTPQVGATESNGSVREGTDGTGTPQVRGQIDVPLPADEPRSIPAPDVPRTGCTGSVPSEPAQMSPEAAAAALGGQIIADYETARAAPSSPAWWYGSGRAYGPRDAVTVLMAHGRRVALRDGGYYVDGQAAAPEALEQRAAELEPRPPVADPAPSGDVGDQAAAPAPAAPAPATRPARLVPPAERARTSPRGPAYLVLGGDGRGYAPGGEALELPRPLGDVGHVGELTALALELGTPRLWVPREARELLGLPATLPALGKREGVPHRFTEAADPAAWDAWPDKPGGLAGWMQVYRVPSTLHEGAALAFPEWLPGIGDGPQLAGLVPAELAAALELIWQATTYPGRDGRTGGVHYARSPGATMRRLLGASARRRRSGPLEAAEMPPPFTRGPGSALSRVPGLHMAPPLEVPPGYLVGRLDVRSCFLAAVNGTDFGVGDFRHVRGARKLDATPGIHLLRGAPAASAHPALWPVLPPAGRREAAVTAWADTNAARWLADRGVPFTIAESYVWPELHGRRVFASIADRLGPARDALEAREDAPARVAAAVVKAMYARVFGGWLASSFGGERDPDDPWFNPAWWLTIRVQAEVRKQRNLWPGLSSGAMLVLGAADVDSVLVAAPSREALEAVPGTGGKPAIGPGRGKFKLEATAAVTPGLAAELAGRGSPRKRLAAIREALGEQPATPDGGPDDA